VTTTLERDDLGVGRGDSHLIAMKQVRAPVGKAWNEYSIFAGMAERLGVAEEFTEGRDTAGWLAHLYDGWRARMASQGHEMPGFAEFWAAGAVALPRPSAGRVLLAEFRADPAAHPLGTPSGRIELYSATVAGFGYPDCPGYPCWLQPEEWLGAERAERFPLHLIANQPTARLHGQLDMGGHSRASKVAGREPIRLHPADAAERGIQAGDVVRVRNDMGSCLAGAVLSEDVRRGVVQLSTGSWFDPSSELVTCAHGNPNVLTTDRGTSRLAQGCAGQHALVDVARMPEPAPPVRAHRPPKIIQESPLDIG
jgi:biotin/methionine sulfoxide reductase